MPSITSFEKKITIISFQNNANAGDDNRQQNTPTINPFPIPGPVLSQHGSIQIRGRGTPAPGVVRSHAGKPRCGLFGQPALGALRLEMPLGDKMPLRSLIRGVKRGKVYLYFYC